MDNTVLDSSSVFSQTHFSVSSRCPARPQFWCGALPSSLEPPCCTDLISPNLAFWQLRDSEEDALCSSPRSIDPHVWPAPDHHTRGPGDSDICLPTGGIWNDVLKALFPFDWGVTKLETRLWSRGSLVLEEELSGPARSSPWEVPTTPREHPALGKHDWTTILILDTL